MYNFIKGQVISFDENHIVIECNNIGYDIFVSNNTLDRLGKIGETVTIYTCVKTTDDTIKLYGFYGKEEKSMFEKLISISGVGPKMSIQILSGIDPKALALNIVNSDYKALSQIKGIGKKTAMRIIMELKEKLAQEDFDSMSDTTSIPVLTDQVSQDAILALVSLGMNKAEATKAVAAARERASTVEQIITLSLRGLK